MKEGGGSEEERGEGTRGERGGMEVNMHMYLTKSRLTRFTQPQLQD